MTRIACWVLPGLLISLTASPAWSQPGAGNLGKSPRDNDPYRSEPVVPASFDPGAPAAKAGERGLDLPGQGRIGAPATREYRGRHFRLHNDTGRPLKVSVRYQEPEAGSPPTAGKWQQIELTPGQSTVLTRNGVKVLVKSVRVAAQGPDGLTFRERELDLVPTPYRDTEAGVATFAFRTPAAQSARAR